MKEVAILLLVALLLNGCSSSTAVQTKSGTVWQAAMLGGAGTSSGFSFTTQFSLSSSGSLSISNFQLVNQEQDTCFGTSGISEAGTLNVTYNSADVVTGTFSFTMTSAAGDTVTLTSSDITGTINTATSPYTLNTGATITGGWVLVPASGTPCVAASGTFTMTESTAS